MLNPGNRKIEFSQVFDTYKSSVNFDDFIDDFDEIPEGLIIIAASEDESTENLSHKGR